MLAYSDPTRETEPHALPNVEVFHQTAGDFMSADDGDVWYEMHTAECATDGDPCRAANDLAGWYWWTCLPGCLPDSEPDGPYDTEEEALAAAHDIE